MPFNSPFTGNYQNPIVESVFIRDWDEDAMIPPPGSDYIVTENDIILAAENGDELITE